MGLKKILTYIFGESSTPKPADKGQVFSLDKMLEMEVPSLQDAAPDNSFVKLETFFQGHLLPALKKTEKGNGFLGNGLFSMAFLSKLGDGKCSFFYPRYRHRDQHGEIVFPYECYVPARFLVDQTASLLKMARFMGKESITRQKEAGEAYIKAIKETLPHAVPAESLKKDYGFYQKGTGRPPFTQSAVEAGIGFDFVLRPNKRNAPGNSNGFSPR